MHYSIHIWFMVFRSGGLQITLKDYRNTQIKRVVRLITYNDQFPLIPGPLPASNPISPKLELLKIKDIFILIVCVFLYTNA